MIKLTPIDQDFCEDTVFALSEIRQLYTKVHEVDEGDAWLAIHEDGDSVEFELFTYTYQELGDDEQYVERVFYGYGFAGNLRELRHTYWGHDGKGYWHYPNLKAVVACLPILEEYFDL